MIEKKITSEGYEEVFFRPEQAGLTIASVLSTQPWIPTENISMVSCVERINKVNITYDGLPPDYVFDKFDVQPYHILCDYYAIELVGDKVTLKIYDRNFVHHPIPSLPSGSKIDCYGSGLGVLYNLDSGITNWRKVYYIFNDRYYGLEYDVETMVQKSISEYQFEGELSEW